MTSIVLGGIIGYFYHTLCRCINKLHVEIDEHEIRVWQAPLPHWRRVRIPLSQLVGLEQRSLPRYRISNDTPTTRVAYFVERLDVVLRNGARRTIITDYRDAPVRHLTNEIAEATGLPLT